MRAHLQAPPGTVRVLAAVVAATAVGLVAYALVPAETQGAMAIWWAFNLAAAGACFFRGLRATTLRFGWFWLSGGVLLYTAADISWDLNTLAGTSNVNTLGDVLYQVAYVTLGIGLWLLGGRDEGGGLEDFADTALWAAALGGAVYLWLWLPTDQLGLEPATLRSNAFTLATMVGLSTLVLRNVMAANTYRRAPLLLITVGVGLVIVADVSFWFQGVQAGWSATAEFDAAGWDYLYMVAWATVAAGALLPAASTLQRRRQAPTSALVRPAVGLVLALPVMLALADSPAPMVAAIALMGVISARMLLLVVDAAAISRRSRLMVTIAGELLVNRQPDSERIEGWLVRIMGPNSVHLRRLDDGECPRSIAVVPLAHLPGSESDSDSDSGWVPSVPGVVCVHDWHSPAARADLLELARLFAAAYPAASVGSVAPRSGTAASDPVDAV